MPEKTGDEGNEGHRKRLRERFARAGFDALSDHEVLELLLTLCIPRRDVKGPAKRLLARFGSLRGVLDARPEDLDAVPGIGSVTPVALRIIRESAALYLRQVMESAPVFDGGRRLCEFLLLRMGGLRVECLDVLYLDSGLRLLNDGVERQETGTVDQVLLTPRKLAESALRRGAKSIVLAHNHPGGNPSFSQSDIELTLAARSALAAVGIELMDHILVSDGRAVSFRGEGLFEPRAPVEWGMAAESRSRYRTR